MISCRNLTRRFGGFTAVNNLSFTVAAGSICAFLGPNGAGKSTSVKMLSGLLAPSSGSATVAGIDVAGGGVELKRRIGVLPENLGLFDDLTVEEHLHLTGDLYGLSTMETRARAGQLLRVLGLAGGRHRFANRCSHGMRKKTSLAMALIPNPKVLFLDEPFEGIDPVSSKAMGDLLAAGAARGITVLLTSHILPVVERLAQQIIMIRGGEMVWNSSAGELPRPLEELYFELVESPVREDLEWLGSGRS